MKEIEAVILDFNRTLFDPKKSKIEDEAIELLNLIKNKRWKSSLITIGNEAREEQISPIISFFDFIKIVPTKKRSDFGKLVRIMGVNCCKTLVIGDRVKKEIRFGKELGIRTIWLKKGKFSNELPNENEKPDWTFNSLTEITSFLKSNQLSEVITK